MITFKPATINTPDKLVYCDFETQSLVNLKSVGAKVYIEHPTTRVMSGVFLREKQAVVWCPKKCLPKFGRPIWPITGMPGDYKYTYDTSEDIPAVVKKWSLQGATFVAHNAEMFDAWLVDRLLDFRPNWLDTIHLCRAAGLPGALGQVLQILFGLDKEDQSAMMLLTQAKARAGTGVVYPVGTTAVWQKLIKYNMGDVLHLARLCDWLRQAKVCEPKVIETHAKINDRGFLVDKQFLSRLKHVWAEAQADSVDEIERITKGKLKEEDIRSPKKVKAWLEEMGFYLPGDSLDNKVVNQILEHPERYTDGLDERDGTAIIAMLAERQNAVRATVGKLDRIMSELNKASRVQRCIVYFGAHTGRFSGRGVQPHNFPRGIKWDKDTRPHLGDLLDKTLTLEQVQKAAKAYKCSVSDVLSTLTRNIIVPDPGHKFIVFDYAAIEARMVAWMARCTGMLAAFGDPKKDIYCEMASKLFGYPCNKREHPDQRFVGKQIVLGCGYQMGAEKFGMSCRVFLIDLDKAGVTAEDCVTAYRKGFPEVPKLWKALNNAAINAVERPGTRYAAGRCSFIYEQGWLKVQLPSGRILRYRNARLVERPSPWNPKQLIEQVEYTNNHGFTRSLYGGLLAENISQANSRDILVDAVCRIDDTAPCVLHVHDEGVFQVPSKLAEKVFDKIGTTMSTPPTWAEDFPLMVEGFIGDRYTKGPIPGKKSSEFLLTLKL